MCCSAPTGKHSHMQASCCPVWALQLLYTMYMYMCMHGQVYAHVVEMMIVVLCGFIDSVLHKHLTI